MRTVIPILLFVFPVIAFFVYLTIRFRYKKAGPDEALIVFGRRKLLGKQGPRRRRARSRASASSAAAAPSSGRPGSSYEFLSLRMMTLDIDLRHVYTVQGIPINVKAVAQVKVKGDVEHIRKAAEGFLGVPVDQVQATIKETVAGHLRGIIGTLTVEELYRDQKRFQDSVREEAHLDLEGMGFEFRVVRLPGDPGRRGLPQRARPAQDPGGAQERPDRHRRRRPRRQDRGGAGAPAEGAEAASTSTPRSPTPTRT